jgi:phenylacetate-CoA ligase
MAIDFRVRDFAYPLPILRLRRTMERNQWLPPADLEAYQRGRLRQTIRHAYREVPYYRRLFDEAGLRPDDIREATDLRRLPTLSRDVVRTRQEDLRARDVRRYRPVPCTTSGTTGEPLQFLLDRDSNVLEFVYYWRHWAWAGYRLGDAFADLGATFFMKRPALHEAPVHWQSALRRLNLNAMLLSRRPVAAMADAIRLRRPQFIKGLPSSLFCFARCLEEASIRDLSFRAVFSQGDLLLSAHREALSTAFGCPVLDSFGHMERTVAICQCPDGGYHVNSDYGVLEVVDGTATGTRAGTGRVVGTSLFNLAMPLLRYELSDVIELFEEPRSCPCGRTLPLVKGVLGRARDILVAPDGRYVTTLFLLPESVPGVRCAQFVQDPADELEIRVVAAHGWTPAAGERLLAETRAIVGPSMRVRLRLVADAEMVGDPEGKRPVVVARGAAGRS